MPSAAFKPASPAIKGPQTHALDLTSKTIGWLLLGWVTARCFHYSDHTPLMAGWVVNGELDRVWKEWAVDYPVECLEKLGRSMKNLSEYNQRSDQHSKQVSIEYKSEVLLLNQSLSACTSSNVNRLTFYKFTFTFEQHWRFLEQVVVKFNPNSHFFLFLFITKFSRTFTQIYIQMHVANMFLEKVTEDRNSYV